MEEIEIVVREQVLALDGREEKNVEVLLRRVEVAAVHDEARVQVLLESTRKQPRISFWAD